jgi:hypothetical protein
MIIWKHSLVWTTQKRWSMRASFCLLRKLRRKCVRREDRQAGHSWIHSSLTRFTNIAFTRRFAND